MGYSVFAPDLIAHGKSEGETISMGGFDSDDLVNWVKKISAENNNADTALFGYKYGRCNCYECNRKKICQVMLRYL